MPTAGGCSSRHHNTSVFGVSNNWLGPTGLGSPIHHLAMKLFRSGATPGLVPTNGRWKFKPEVTSMKKLGKIHLKALSER